MFLFDEFDIKAGATSDIFKLGKRLLLQKKLRGFETTDSGLRGQCETASGTVTMALLRHDKHLSNYCSCGQSHGFCEHAVALGLYYLESISAKRSRHISALATEESPKIQLSLSDFLQEKKIEDRLGLMLQFSPDQSNVSVSLFDRHSHQILDRSFFALIDQDAFFASFSDETIAPVIHRWIAAYGATVFCLTGTIPTESLLTELSFLIQKWFIVTATFEPFEIYPEPLKLCMKFCRIDDDIVMNFDWITPSKNLVFSIKNGTTVGQGAYLLIDRVLYPFATASLPQFVKTIAPQEGARLDAKKFKLFVESKRQSLQNSGVDIELDPELDPITIESLQPKLVLHLKTYQNDICAKIHFRYGFRDIYPEEKRCFLYLAQNNCFCERRSDIEEKWLKQIAEMGFKSKRKHLLTSAENTKYKLHRFVMQNFDQLIVFGQDTLNKLALSKEKMRPMIHVKLHKNRIEVEYTLRFWLRDIEIDAQLVVPDGNLKQFVSYETNIYELQLFKPIQKLLAKSKRIQETPLAAKVHLSVFVLYYSKLRGNIDASTATLDLVAAIQSSKPHQNKKYPLPAGEVTLHPYQDEGVQWLLMWHKYRLGGILADDMGLGKTLQTLTCLNALYTQNSDLAPSLIVMPTTLLFNWENESKRFFPQLTTLTYTGANREKHRQMFSETHLIFCSYGILRRDIDLLKDIPFMAIVLDEAQVIKNSGSKISGCTRQLTAGFRLALTGTPIENRLSEIWSIFQFLIPGFFSSFTQFKNNYESPFQRGDLAVVQHLRDLIRPFILRRLKESIALELPKKTESHIYCDLSDNQSQHYLAALDDTRQAISQTIKELGIENAQFHIFSLLTRLRQICCHPSLVLNDPTADSQKFELAQDMIKQIVSGNHKIVLFSQFVKMLDLFEGWLKKEGIGYTVLTGQIKDKKKVIDQFNNNTSVSVFLISLRAGGTGINLTSADYVIHYDPWWNPSVENQATDRVHRIGQDKPVFVYKFITKDTVEDKILSIQAKKAKLYANLIDTITGKTQFLTKEDIDELFQYKPGIKGLPTDNE